MAWAPDYVTTSELKAYLRITDTVDDTQLGFAITAASRAIDKYCGRQFGLTASAEARRYTAEWDKTSCLWFVPVDDFMTTVGLVVGVDLDKDDLFADFITDYSKRPFNASQKSKPWTEIYIRSTSTIKPGCTEGGVEVTAKWGWTAVPTVVKEACLLQASRFHSRRESPFGVAGSPDAGSELRLLAKVDADVGVALTDVIRWWGSR
jgi:hypothetical protein